MAEQEFKRVAKAAKAPGDDGSTAASPLDTAGLRSVARALEKMDEVFGIYYEVPAAHGGAPDDAGGEDAADSAAAPSHVMELVTQRAAAKEAKDWGRADALRAEIAELGFAVEDGRGACQVRRL